MKEETRDERYFINWFNHFVGNESILYVLLEDKERYLKTKTIAHHPIFGRPRKDVNTVKALYRHVWHTFKKIEV